MRVVLELTHKCVELIVFGEFEQAVAIVFESIEVRAATLEETCNVFLLNSVGFDKIFVSCIEFVIYTREVVVGIGEFLAGEA